MIVLDANLIEILEIHTLENLTRNTPLSIEFDSPANRIIQQLQPKNKFTINTNLPDLAFLRQLSIQGRLRYFQGTSAGAATLITITPTEGETFFLYKIVASSTFGTQTAIFDIINDGQTRLSFGANTTGSTAREIDILDSLVGDGIKTITVVASSTNTMRASAFGWIENTSRIRDVAT